MILLDTSAIYALADRADPNHTRARELFRQAIAGAETFLVHSYLLAEAAALLQHRLGLTVALRFLNDAKAFRTHWISAQDHFEAVDLLARRRKGGLSLVDCASFVVMRRLGVEETLAFDDDFPREGFRLYGDEPSP